MAFSTDEKERLFEIFGIPRDGDGAEIEHISDWPNGPSLEEYNFDALVTELEARITTTEAAADRENRVQALLTEWDSITPYSELEVYASGGAVGVLAHDERRREGIRKTIGNIMGFWAPKNGFWGEIQRRRRLARGNHIPR